MTTVTWAGRTRRMAAPLVVVIVLAIFVTTFSGHTVLDPGFGGVAATDSGYSHVVGGRWSWWACAAWAVLTTTQCTTGNLISCGAMLITYSQNC